MAKQLFNFNTITDFCAVLGLYSADTTASAAATPVVDLSSNDIGAHAVATAAAFKGTMVTSNDIGAHAVDTAAAFKGTMVTSIDLAGNVISMNRLLVEEAIARADGEDVWGCLPTIDAITGVLCPAKPLEKLNFIDLRGKKTSEAHDLEALQIIHKKIGNTKAVGIDHSETVGAKFNSKLSDQFMASVGKDGGELSDMLNENMLFKILGEFHDNIALME